MGPDLVISRLKGLADSRMRVLALVEALRDGEPVVWIDIAAAILARAHTLDDIDALIALETLTHAAAEPALPYEARQKLYEAAIGRGEPAIARLFLAASPSVPLPAQLEKQLQPERPLRPAGRPLTLGERKSLARTHRRDQILLMRRDPHPAVVAILLDNPHITESDVMFMASMRPNVPESLSILAAHPRWSVRHAVKRALVLNPSTRLADAIRLATTLRGSDLAELAVDPAVPEMLRTHAAELRAAALRRPRA